MPTSSSPKTPRRRSFKSSTPSTPCSYRSTSAACLPAHAPERRPTARPSPFSFLPFSFLAPGHGARARSGRAGCGNANVRVRGNGDRRRTGLWPLPTHRQAGLTEDALELVPLEGLLCQ